MASSCLQSSDNAFGPIVQGCRSNFDFTLLFEQSILSIGPAALFLLAAPPRLTSLFKSKKKTIPNRYRTFKAITCLLLLGIQLGLLVLWSTYRVTRATVPSAVLSFLASVLVLPLSRLEHNRSIKPSSLLSVYLLVSVAFDAVQVRTLFLRHDESAILGLFTTSVGLKLVLLLLESLNKRKYLRAPYSTYPPESTSGVFGRSFFWWLNPMLATGFRRLMTLDDLFVTDNALLSEPLGEEMKKSWNKYRSSGRWALAYAVFHSLRYSLALIVFPRLCLIGFNYAQPFLISSAIIYVSKPAALEDKNNGYGLIGATALIYLGITFCTTHYQHQIYRSCTQFRGGMIALIYDKTLKMQADLADESRSITLMGTDIDRLVVSLDSLCEAVPRLIELCIGIWLLATRLGWVCVAPIIVTIISVVASSRVTKLVGGRQRQWVTAIQRRVSMTSSMLGSMKSVKMMGLSNFLTDTLQNQRIRELDLSKHFRVMGLWRMMLSFLPPILGPLATFVIYAIQASAKGTSQLSTSETFSSLSIITLLTSPASEFLMSLPLIGMSTGCLDRIQNFLLNEDCEDERLLSRGRSDMPERSSDTDNVIELQDLSKESNDLALSVQNATIRPAVTAPPALHDISFQAVKGSITMVIGVVGSGKSTLLKAIIGELRCDSGSISAYSQDSAYCSQTPWLQNATVRDIICGPAGNAEGDEQWYRTAVHACAFDQDIMELPDQDDTLIGSRGVTLSGGQKQRLALARAVYARRDLIVLDDVLSAIDAATEHQVVERLLGSQGVFKKLGSTVVLATHAIHHLPLADNIIVLGHDGAVLEQGAFEQLRSQGGFVSNLIIHPGVLGGLDAGPAAEGKAQASKAAVQLPDTSDLSRQIGDVAVYKYYFCSIGWKVVAWNLTSSFTYMLGNQFPSLWLNFYAEGIVKSLPLFASVYAACAVIALSAATMVLYTLYMQITPRSGASLHRILLNSVMRAPQAFFDNTDSGLILNRFSQDMTLIDGSLPAAAVMASSASWQCLAQFGLIAIGSSYMALTCPLLLVAAYFLQKYYLRTSRQMRFLDLECKSPLFTQFTETLEGLSTIRAFGWQHHFIRENIKRLDTSQRPYYLLYCIQRWLNLVLLLIVGVTATVVMALATNLTQTTSGGRLGVSLSSIVNFNSSLSLLMMFWTQLETSLGAVARVKGFQDSTESEHKEQENFEPSENWPTHGEIHIKNVSASYGDNPALRSISLTIKAGEKIGICGRTGSGKSTLLSVLLRLVDMTAGTIIIDDLDLSRLPRETVRTRITAIPQDPFIVAGSVRLNADPKSTSLDADIITALTKVNLWPLLSSRGGLDADMSANPLSQGQQQIFCLARAMLRGGNDNESGNRILVLDEATSNVDAETDRLMQKLIREEFGKYTILTVAHRLDTILDADRVVVMDSGRVVEVGEPLDLLKRENSAFRALRGRSE
ncbi:P-loop containing nucleoside triphosphate hydrolase protein [Mollisia scopiformis]|uniref:p-loop containing nucleoside triphosphate hydrolase protein n=1 Tax=Mollisia scopiformis TaxID=149040 RepID=A0A194X7Z0_MOLSC|nr:P-loop containing nucleoside triphosphate hydrolase protein [Mollisia scopiformis]KUJ15922.1 P-loop containing nucleoside triphosphate hydrolase protein [Mollisia scopiformis]